MGYDAYTLVRELSDSYMQADTQLDIDKDLENAIVDPSALPPIVLTFLEGIGAGGRLTELTAKQVEQLADFFDREFPQGEETEGFYDFVFDYAEVYAIEGKRLGDSGAFVNAVINYGKTYDRSRTSMEGEVRDVGEVEFKNSQPSTFFASSSYSLVAGDPTKIGSIVKVDGISTIKNGKQEYQITFPDDHLIKMEVVQYLGDNDMKLVLVEDYILNVKGIASYRMRKGTVFIYDLGRKTIQKRIK